MPKKLTYKELQEICDTQKKQIEYLESKIENFESIQRGHCCDCCEEAVQKYCTLEMKCLCFDDDAYFKGLDYKTIAALAKKSIRLTTENIQLSEKLEKVGKFLKFIIEKTQEYADNETNENV